MSSQGFYRKQYASGGEEDEGASSFATSRGNNPRSDSLSRSNHYSRTSVKSRTSSPSKVDMRDDAASTSSRTYHEPDDRWATDDRYNYTPSKDGHRRGKRDDHDQRAKKSYAVSRDSNFSSSSKRYIDDHDQDREGDEPAHESSWTPRKGNKDYGRSHWTPKENKGGQRGDMKRGGYDFNDRFNEFRNRDDSGGFNGQERRRDNGWATRRAANGDSGSHILQSVTSDRAQDDRSGDARAPVPSNNVRQDNPRKNRKKHKKHKTEKRAREWRPANDDTQLNNWTRRDNGDSNKIQRSSRKRYRSPSLTPRSRTPDSYYSRRSSPRGRSRTRTPTSLRSRTPTPGRSRSRSRSSEYGARRRRADSRDKRSRSPYDHRPGKGPPRRWSRSHSRSPPPRRYGRSPARSPARSPWSPEPRRRRSRGRSFSSASSISRSPSRSPRERSRTVHRLPLVTSVEDVRKLVSKAPLNLPQRPPQSQRNGEGKGKRDRKRNRDRLADNAADARGMPPPTLPSSATNNQDMNGWGPVSPSHPSSVREPVERTPQTIATKKAGFKPIGQASSALKRFFPGDEDDEEEPDVKIQRSSASAAPDSSSKSKPSPVSMQHSEQVYAREPNLRIHQNGTAYASQMEVHSTQNVQQQHSLDQPPSPMVISPIPDSAQRHPDARDYREQDRRTHGLPRSKQGSGYAEDMFGDLSIHVPDATLPPTPDQGNEELYRIVSQVGEGTFGKVYKARNSNTGQFVALKRIRMEAERDGFPVTAMREIKLLQSIRHDNVIRLYEMMVSNGSVFMVFEYMDHDLTGVLSQTQFSFTDAHLKSLCRQMLAGLAYLHHKGVIHRDIKGSNILINNRGVLKLADFGLARFYQKRRRSDYTNRVITLWYRPPELLFGTTVYGPEVDMWSAGCIMLELFTKKPIFQGNDEIHQLDVVFKILGTPNVERWPGVTSLPWYELVKPKDFVPNHFRELFQKWLSPAALDLAESLLAYDPVQRITALEAMEAPYFLQESPAEERPVGLATLEGEWHELETKRERAKKRRKTEGGTQ